MDWLIEHWQWLVTTIIAFTALLIAYKDHKLNKQQVKPSRNEEATFKTYESTDSLAFRHLVKVIFLRIANGLQLVFIGGIGLMLSTTYEDHQKLWLSSLGFALLFVCSLIFMRLYLWDKHHKNRYK